MHRLKQTKTGAPDLTTPGALGIRTVKQNPEPEGTGHGLVPPVPFGSKVDDLLSPAAER